MLSPMPDEYPGAGASSLFSVLTSKAVVKRERLKDVVRGCRYRINNILDHKYRPRPVHEILKSANEMIDVEMEYSFLEKNCEHFVTKLRYDKAECGQVKVRPLLWGTVSFLDVCLGWGGWGCAARGVNHHE